jgi:NhaA family Na+:H+ antiporter
MSDSKPTDSEASLPKAPIQRITGPLQHFLHVEAAGGSVLVVASAIAIALANSPFAEQYLAIWKEEFSIGFLPQTHSLKHWISDGLMAIFFFVIGLEVKRELVLGELRDFRKALLPIAAAIGGMVVPAGIYLALQWGEPGERGWGIPMATDIAFVVGCMAVLGSRVPPGLRVLLVSLAIADDIGAIIVIAVGYTAEIDWRALLLAGMGLASIWGLARAGVRSVGLYTAIGVGVWYGFHESGVHATIAGVIIGLMTPTESWVSQGRLQRLSAQLDDFLHGEWDVDTRRRAFLRRMETAAREAVSPLERLEHGLHPWVSFAIIPAFALANAGVPFQFADMGEPVAVAVMLGLFVGKPLGITLFSFLAVKAGWAKLPEGVTWGVLIGAGFLAGIGFTMALFISMLALEGDVADVSKVGILEGSLASAVVGMGLLMWLLPKGGAKAGDSSGE